MCASSLTPATRERIPTMAKATIELTGNLEKIVGQAFPPGALKAALNRAVTVAMVDARNFIVNVKPPLVSKGWQFKGGGKIGPKTGGRLLASLSGGPDNIWQQNEAKMERRLGSNVKYADCILSQDDELGGEPFVIRPKNKKYLVFPIGPNPKTDIVRAKSVTHPGAKEIGRRKTGKSVALLTQAKELVEKGGEKYVKDAVRITMEVFR